MKYLIMEIHPAYAIALDEEGRFVKVANMGYSVGDSVCDVILMKENGKKSISPSFAKRFAAFASVAACLCLMVLTAFSIMSAYGSVRIKINPDVKLHINRFDYVVSVEGMNADGETLLKDYSYKFKKVDRVSDELADRAKEMGFLKEGGEIHLTVESKHTNWKKTTEDRLVIELDVHIKESVKIIIDQTDDLDDFDGDDDDFDDDLDDDLDDDFDGDDDDLDDGFDGDDGKTTSGEIVIPVDPDDDDDDWDDWDDSDESDDDDDFDESDDDFDDEHDDDDFDESDDEDDDSDDRDDIDGKKDDEDDEDDDDDD